MESGALDAAERAELERLRTEAQASRAGANQTGADRTGPAPAGAASAAGRWSRRGRWLGACALLIVSAILSGLAVVAVYLRAEVLDTETYVQTVAPLAEDVAVRQAVANRLTDEIITRTDVAGIAAQLAAKLVEQGAPERVEDLVAPAVSGLRSFLYDQIYGLLGTSQFQAIWEQVNRVAHQGVVAVLTGGQQRFVSTAGTTVTLDLGALLSAAKQQLTARGFGFVSRVPDVSISYELVDSKKLPTIRRYTRLLNSVATWLPFVALGLLVAGVLVAPNRRRAVITGFAAIGTVAVALLATLALARTYYLDNLPSTVRSPDAAAAVVDTLLRFLIASLQTLLVLAAIFVVAALLAGPGRPATAARRLLNSGLDAGARGLARTGSWAGAVGRALRGARWAIQAGVVLAAVVGLILANRPSIAAVLWTALVVLVLLAVVEMFARTPGRLPAAGWPDRQPVTGR